MIACQNGHGNVALLLIDKGANIEAKDNVRSSTQLKLKNIYRIFLSGGRFA